MSFVTQLETIVSGALANRRGTRSGIAYSSLANPPLTKWVMEGKVWQVQDTSTQAALVAPPDVTSNLTVQNPNGSGKYYIILGVSGYTNAVAATLGLVTAWHCVHKLPVANFTRDITLQVTGAESINGLRGGQGAYQGLIILDRAATVVNDGWVPTPLQILNNIATTNFVSNSAALITPVILPPGFHYSLQTTATVVTFETGMGITWAEVNESELE